MTRLAGIDPMNRMCGSGRIECLRSRFAADPLPRLRRTQVFRGRRALTESGRRSRVWLGLHRMYGLRCPWLLGEHNLLIILDTVIGRWDRRASPNLGGRAV